MCLQNGPMFILPIGFQMKKTNTPENMLEKTASVSTSKFPNTSTIKIIKAILSCHNAGHLETKKRCRVALLERRSTV